MAAATEAAATTATRADQEDGRIGRVTAVVRRDLLSSRKDPMVIYLVLSSILFAIGLRLFIGGFQQVGAEVVIAREDTAVLADRLDDYLKVHVVNGPDAVRDRVARFDHVAGIVPAADGGWQVVLQGNEDKETRALPGLVLRQLERDGAAPPAMADVGEGREPVRDWIAVFYGIGALLVGGVIMGFTIIEDKENQTMPALGVSPLSHAEYIAARSALVVLFSLAMVLVSLWVLGATFNPLQILAVTLLGVPVGLLVGFCVGALSSDTIGGIANLKFANLVVTAPGGLTFFIPDAAERLFYLLPQYWAFVCYRELLVEQSSWPEIIPTLGSLLATSAVAVAVAFPWFRGRLAFSRA